MSVVSDPPAVHVFVLVREASFGERSERGIHTLPRGPGTGVSVDHETCERWRVRHVRVK